MARKRMFNIQIVDSDAFLDMPLSTQALYFHLNMRADDDGFVGNPKKIQRLVGASEDDLKLLIAKRFLLVFEDGVIVIKHWRIHNTIKNDRYNKTLYIEELNQLKLKENKAYTFDDSDKTKEIAQCFQNGSKMDPEYFQNGNTDIDIDIGLDKIKNKDIYIAQSDFENHSMPAVVEASVITITLNDKSEYPIYQNMIDEWKELYPNVDVEQQLKCMKGWCNANPTKRKTKRGILRFINAWLTREQDKPSFQKNNNVNTYQKQQSIKPINTDYDDLDDITF